jgi:hypothetical protein
MAREQFTVTPDIAKKLREKSKKVGLPISEIVRRAVVLYLDNETIPDVDTGVQWGGKREPSEPEKVAS